MVLNRFLHTPHVTLQYNILKQCPVATLDAETEQLSARSKCGGSSLVQADTEDLGFSDPLNHARRCDE
jgi:hypothetical protein